MAKQTGPRYLVKGTMMAGIAQHRRIFVPTAALIASCSIMFALSACADASWQNPRRDATEARADEQACNDRAEEAALKRAGRQRANYEVPRPTVEPGLSRGKTPMQLAERAETSNDFEREMKNCMTSKGYTLGPPEDR